MYQKDLLGFLVNNDERQGGGLKRGKERGWVKLLMPLEESRRFNIFKWNLKECLEHI